MFREKTVKIASSLSLYTYPSISLKLDSNFKKNLLPCAHFYMALYSKFSHFIGGSLLLHVRFLVEINHDNGTVTDQILSYLQPRYILGLKHRYNEITLHWMAGKTNLANIFTKEDNDVAHYCSLQDIMVVLREQFWNPKFLTDNSLGLLKRGSAGVTYNP